jgi:hypothetical protein
VCDECNIHLILLVLIALILGERYKLRSASLLLCLHHPLSSVQIFSSVGHFFSIVSNSPTPVSIGVLFLQRAELRTVLAVTVEWKVALSSVYYKHSPKRAIYVSHPPRDYLLNKISPETGVNNVYYTT